MIDFSNSDVLSRWYEAFYASLDQMAPFRENRTEALKEYLGKHYGDFASAEEVPLPWLEQFVDVYTRLLIPSNPKSMVTGKTFGMRSMARDMEAFLNFRGEEMCIGDTLRRWVRDSFFAPFGVLECGIETHEHFEWEGESHYYDEFFLDNIDWDDYLIDMSAKREATVGFEGHCFRMPLELAKADPLFDGVDENGDLIREKLEADHADQFNITGDEKAKSLEIGNTRIWSQDYKDFVTLWQVFFHAEQEIAVIQYSRNRGFAGMPLRQKKWKGPRYGPYMRLSYSPVSAMLCPKPPVAKAIDLHRMANAIMCKLGDDAVNWKRVLLFESGASKDAKKIIKASNGAAVPVADPKNFQEVSFRGIDQTQLAFLLQVYQFYNRATGNLEVVGGLGAQAGTLGQEKLLAEQSGTQVKDMQSTVVNRCRDVYRQMGWYYWTDPLRVYEGERQIDGVEVPVAYELRPEDREGNVYKLNFDVNVYSFNAKTPLEEVADLDAFVMQIVFPMMPVIQQQGGVFDAQSYLRIRSRLANQPYYDELLKWEAPQEMNVPQMQPPKRAGAQGGAPGGPRADIQAGPGRDMQQLTEMLNSAAPQPTGAM